MSKKIEKYFATGKQVMLGGLVTYIVILVRQFGNSSIYYQHFYTRGASFLWYTPLVVGSAVANLLIAISFITISHCLYRWMVKAPSYVVDPYVFYGFIFFILFSGISHLMNVVVIWVPMYWLALGVDIATAIASSLTAIYVVQFVPQLIVMSGIRKREDLSSAQRLIDSAVYDADELPKDVLVERLRIISNAMSELQKKNRP